MAAAAESAVGCTLLAERDLQNSPDALPNLQDDLLELNVLISSSFPLAKSILIRYNRKPPATFQKCFGLNQECSVKFAEMLRDSAANLICIIDYLINTSFITR